MKNKRVWPAFILGSTISLGIIIASYLVSDALVKFRAANRFVTVKGLAEQEVDADLAIWPISFEDADNDLSLLYQRLGAKRDTITKFLLNGGLPKEDISFLPPQVMDFQAHKYAYDRGSRPLRYRVEATILVRTENVPLIKKLMEQSTELINQGIVIMQADYQRSTEFLFTGLNAIKPAMIEEATKNARKAAEKFAKDSGSTVGKIRTARQGLFTITNRDNNSPDRKKIRVVTTVEYFLVDE